MSCVALRQSSDGACRVRVLPKPAPVRDALAGMPILCATPPTVLGLLAREAEFVSFASGASIFERDSTPTGLFFVSRGGVRLMALGPDGRSRVIEIFEQGAMFGELGVFTGARYRTWTQAIGPTVLVHVPRDSVLQAVGRDTLLSNRILAAVCARIQRLIDSLGCMSSGSAPSRVAAYLIELHERSARPDGPVVLPAPKNTIASLLNLTPETLSRVLRNLTDAGLVTVAGRRIRIRNHPQLLRLVSSPGELQPAS